MNLFKLETVKGEPFGSIRLEATMPEMSGVIGEGFRKLGELFGIANAMMADAPYAHYLSFEGGKAVFDLGFSVPLASVERLRLAGAQIGQTPDGMVLKGIHIGPYETVSETYESMSIDLKRRNLEGTPDMWERYYSPPGTSPEKTMTEVIWPIVSSPSKSDLAEGMELLDPPQPNRGEA